MTNRAAMLVATALTVTIAAPLESAPARQATTTEPRRAIALRADDPSIGPSDAPVTLVEFADFECLFCRRLSATLLQLRQRYGDRLRIVWKDLPLDSIHPHALQAAQAARCATEQGRFWDYHDRLLVVRTLDAPALKQYAADVALDVPRFAACVDSAKYAERVLRDQSEARGLGVTSTPTTFVNGRMIVGAKPYETFAGLIDAELGVVTR